MMVFSHFFHDNSFKSAADGVIEATDATNMIIKTRQNENPQLNEKVPEYVYMALIKNPIMLIRKNDCGSITRSMVDFW